MEIFESNINQPVSFYPKNTGNNINTAIDEGTTSYLSNVFSPEINEQLRTKNKTKTVKRKRNNRRLNTIDSEYFPDEIEEKVQDKKVDDNNFFIEAEVKSVKNNIKRAFIYFIENTPLLNYCYLKQKEKKIQKTVETLKDINQNVDDLLSSSVPYGEEGELYSTITRNLTDAANVLGQVKKDL